MEIWTLLLVNFEEGEDRANGFFLRAVDHSEFIIGNPKNFFIKKSVFLLDSASGSDSGSGQWLALKSLTSLQIFSWLIVSES